jgi:hypothetical protein
MRLRAWWRSRQWRRFRAENQREILRLEAERAARALERWGYSATARICRREWAKASEGQRDHWRQMGTQGF